MPLGSIIYIKEDGGTGIMEWGGLRLYRAYVSDVF